MDTIPLDPTQSQSKEALLAFLEGCRLRAAEKGHWQLVSIALKADNLDPLAVLESIYEESELHFYIERKSDGFALAGAESAVSFSPSGPNRFKESKAFVKDAIDNTIAIGDESLPLFGPHFFCFYSFGDESEGGPFGAGTLFVPVWQVGTRDGVCVAIANACVDADSDILSIANRIWNANTKFQTFDYSKTDIAKEKIENVAFSVVSESEVGEVEGFADSIESAVREIRNGAYDKIVLARALEMEANQAFHPLEVLNTLRESYADCYAFSVANGEGQSFIGASPERLVRVKANTLLTEALAGSAPRGRSAGEDAYLGNALLESEKDLHEHKLVQESILRRLDTLGVVERSDEKTVLKKLHNVQHLHTPIFARMPNGLNIFDLLGGLHPTPAVGGSPRDKARAAISEYENFDRGLYAGAIGWVNAQEEGEFLVSIRSALIDGKMARLYAGVGIVEGSVAEKEIQETNLKFQVMKQNLL